MVKKSLSISFCLTFRTEFPNTRNPKLVDSSCKKFTIRISRRFDTKSMYEGLI